MFRTSQLPGRRESLTLIAIWGAGCLFFGASIFRSSAQCLSIPQWTQIGPSPLIINPPDGADGMGPDAGMVRDIAIDPSGFSDQTIYVATDSGGVWKTQDGGATWSPKTDFMPSLNMGAVALDPGNPSTVYAGTGNELNQGGVSKGAGIYKSVNGGDTWTILGGNIFTNIAINRIVLTTPNVLLVGSGNGVYRSIDGGMNFGNNAPLFNNGSPIRPGDVTDDSSCGRQGLGPLAHGQIHAQKDRHKSNG